MNPMHRIPTPLVLFVLAFALPFASSGCGKQACFFWSEAEGACPSTAEALDFFADPSCGSPIESIDSEAEFDGELCCYDVTERDGAEFLCTSPPSPGPSSGFVSSSGGPSGAGGAGGGTPGCQSCSSFITSAFMGASPDNLCQSSAAIFDNLFVCMCGGPCTSACNDTMCAGLSSSTPCFDCATDSVVGCGNEFSTCVNDI